MRPASEGEKRWFVPDQTHPAVGQGGICGQCLLVDGLIFRRCARAIARTRGGHAAAEIVAAQQEKAQDAKLYEPNKAEVWVKKLEEQFLTGALHWHPFFDSAYAGGGFTLGAGYARYVSAYNTIDLRGSFTPSGYMRFEIRVPGPPPVRPPRRPVGPRRLAGGDTGRLLRRRDGRHLEG